MGVILKFRDMFDEGHIEMFAVNESPCGHIVFDILDEAEGHECCIAFDKLTAIKFSKELRKQIALLD
jgi:hypothetical protein